MITNFRDGEVWLVRYYYEDEPSQSKVRPVVLINGQAMMLYGYKMTSQSPRNSQEYSITDLDSAGLSKKTVIRTSKFMEIQENALIRKLGDLSTADLTAFSKLLT